MKNGYLYGTKQKGTSLFEMMIVMLMMAILSYLSLNSYQHVTDQRQLTHSVRDVIAFLSYQQQQSVLFNCQIQIILLLSPINQIIAKPVTALPLSTKQTQFQLVIGSHLTRTTATHFTFCGLRQTLKPMSFILSNGQDEVKIIISSFGRIRACSQNIKAFIPC